jgi:DNA repair protein RecN (Recombination protein N)
VLTDLHIKNFALIDEAHISFEPGLNIMTGETGAGKTIVLEAMNLLLGKRADPVLIGGRGDEASVEASMSGGVEDLVLARSVSESGKNKCYINGKLANVGMVAEKAGELVDFHGQHEHQALLKVSAHLNYLDEFGGAELTTVRRVYTRTFADLKNVEAELANVTAGERERLGRLDLTRFQVDEIDRAALEPGEDEALEKELIILKSSEKLARAVTNALAALQGEDDNPGGVTAVGAAGRELAALKDVDPALDAAAERLNGLSIEADDIARDLSAYRSGIVYDPVRQADAEQRLDLIRTLKKKYGETIEAVVSFKDKAKQELENMENSDARISDLTSRRETLENKLHELADTLTEKRRRTAGVLEKTVEEELAALNLEGCKFKVGFGDTLDLTATGKDRLEFLISPNVGQGLKPLAKIASGGEVSRIMLALKIAFIKADPVPVLIFDEIDAGIGGETAAAVGAKLKQLSSGHQVICISHLPQIAAFADSHLTVSKATIDGATVSTVRLLDEEGRVDELSRMLTGGAATEESSRRHAMELLASARAAKV